MRIFRFIDGINFEKEPSNIPFGNANKDLPLLSNSKKDRNVKSNLNLDKPIIINKTINTNTRITKLCNAYIESKYSTIVKAKKMILTTWRLQEIYADL